MKHYEQNTNYNMSHYGNDKRIKIPIQVSRYFIKSTHVQSNI